MASIEVKTEPVGLGQKEVTITAPGTVIAAIMAKALTYNREYAVVRRGSDGGPSPAPNQAPDDVYELAMDTLTKLGVKTGDTYTITEDEYGSTVLDVTGDWS
jgi:hypothetical protein